MSTPFKLFIAFLYCVALVLATAVFVIQDQYFIYWKDIRVERAYGFATDATVLAGLIGVWFLALGKQVRVMTWLALLPWLFILPVLVISSL